MVWARHNPTERTRNAKGSRASLAVWRKRHLDASEDDHVDGLEQWKSGANPEGVRTLEGDVVKPDDVVHVRILSVAPPRSISRD